MKKRRGHEKPERVWMLPDDQKSSGTTEINFSNQQVLMDIRAVLHDLLDEQKKQTTLIATIFGHKEES